MQMMFDLSSQLSTHSIGWATRLHSCIQVDAIREARLEVQKWKYNFENACNELQVKNTEVEKLKHQLQGSLPLQQLYAEQVCICFARLAN